MSEGGLRALFLAERAMFHRLLVARLGAADEAEDVLQEMWLRLDQANGPIAEPLGYLYRMAANLATDWRRGTLRREARENAWAETQCDVVSSHDGERAVLARERLAEVEAALAAMPDRVATAFRLYRFDELPQKQVAMRMGISVSRVEQLLRDAYQRLYRRIEAGVDGGPRRLVSGQENHDVG